MDDGFLPLFYFCLGFARARFLLFEFRGYSRNGVYSKIQTLKYFFSYGNGNFFLENDKMRKTITSEILQQRYQYKTSRNVVLSELS